MSETSYVWDGIAVGDAVNAPYNAAVEWADVWKSFGLGTMRANGGAVYGSGSEAAQLEGLQVTQNGGGAANVLVNIGRAFVDGTIYINTAAITLAIAANASGNPRIDTIVLRKDFVAQTVRAFVRAGTPAATPNPPTLTQTGGVTWEIPLADIAVANGFVTITNANITPRAAPVNGSDGVYLDRISNASGSDRTTGEPVRLDNSRAYTSAALARVAAGAWLGRTPNGSNGRILNRGIGYVRTPAAVTAGRWGRAGASGAAIEYVLAPIANTFCQFLETTTVAGLALAFIDGRGWDENFAPLMMSASLGAPAAAITITGIPSISGAETYIIEFLLRSAVAANSDTVNLRFGGAALDVTAGNYFSYAGYISTAVAIVASTQNLGATAGLQFLIPGATAPAGSYGFGQIMVSNAPQAGSNKHVSGHYYEQIANTNGNLVVANLGGRWVDTTNALQQLSLISNGGSNLAAGSYINIYKKAVA